VGVILERLEKRQVLLYAGGRLDPLQFEVAYHVVSLKGAFWKIAVSERCDEEKKIACCKLLLAPSDY